MSLKDDVQKVKDKTDKLQQEHSLAWEINHDLKVHNKALKVLLGLSIITNIIIVLLLK